MSNIGCRTSIPRTADFPHHHSLAFTGQQKDHTVSIQQPAARHPDPLLSVARMHTRHIPLVRGQPLFLSGKQRSSMPVVSGTQEHRIESRPTVQRRHLPAHRFRIAQSLLLRMCFPPYPEHIFIRYRHHPQQQVTHHPIMARSIFGRHTALVYPKNTQTIPSCHFPVLMSPQIENQRCGFSPADSQMKHPVRVLFH